MKQRNGSTLVELVMSMTAGSAIMFLAISLVHQTMILTDRSRDRADHNRTLNQLAHCFRRDIHLGKDMSVATDDAMTISSSDGSQVTYRALNHVVIRERKHHSQGFEQDRFVLADTSSATFELLLEPKRASLSISCDSTLHDIPPRVDLHVEAIVGRWQAVERGEGEL